MVERSQTPRRKGPVSLAELVGPLIEPLTARRGIAAADLIAAWGEIAGPLYAASTRPERITWPRTSGDPDAPAPGTLHLRVDGPRAILLQHELPQIVERINAFFGYAAIGQVRILQGPVNAPVRRRNQPVGLGPAEEAALGGRLESVDDGPLRDALDRLGRNVLGTRRRD